MASTKSPIDTLKELNLKLVLQIDELRKENAETSSTKDILQSTACSELSVNTQIRAQIPISSKIIDKSKGSLSIQLPIEGQSDKERDINPDPFPKLEHSLTRPESLAESETFESSLSQDIINNDSVEILEFVEKVHKENISNIVRERNRKKKLQSQGSMQNTSSSSDIQNEVNPIIDIHEHTHSESMPTDQAQNTGIKNPYYKRVEQDLRHKLFMYIKGNNNKISDVFDIQIPEFLLE
ncbi:12224_t:CDS:2, partial [Ambispora gerdemannii]